MSTVIRYTGNVNGYMDFYMGEEIISCENTMSVLATQDLWDAIVEVEDDQTAMSFLGIAEADGKNPSINSALNITLLRTWRIATEKTSGAFKLIGGNATSETLGTEPFEPNNLVFMTNQLSQFGTTIAVGTAVQPQDITDIAKATWDEVRGQALLADVTFIKDIEGGKWGIVGNEMIFYKDDNVTEVARFTLAPNASAATSRTRV